MAEHPSDNPYVRDPALDFAPVGDLDETEAREQVDLLREAIRHHDQRYYVENDPVVADRTYDALFERLRELEAAFGLADDTSPTRRVGGDPRDDLPTVAHTAPMRSLDSSGDPADVRAFVDRVVEAVGEATFTVEPKFDGVSLELVYEDGSLDRAVTRGDGSEGDDVTHNAVTVPAIPLSLPADAPSLLAVRGEVYMPRGAFHDLNADRVERGDDPFANPRNATAGTLRRLDPDEVADRPLDVYVYDVLDTSADLDSGTAARALLSDLGFPVVRADTVTDAEGILAYRADLLAARDDLDYDVDGVVAKVDDYAARETLGETAAHPRWAFAYKFPPPAGETTVREVTVQVGRTGRLTPVALFDPVDVQGVTITRASLHNAGQVRELGVAPGARVVVERAGDVIPEVVEVVETGDGDFSMPDACPVCGGDVVREGELHFCANGTSCPAQLKRTLQQFCSPDAMDVEGVGAEVAATLVEEGLVASVADLYDLSADDLAGLDGFGERSAENLLAQLAASRDCSLARFLYALSIRHVGSERARRLAAAFTLAELREADAETLRAVEDVGPEVAESVAAFFADERNARVVDRLLDAGVSPTRRGGGDELAGRTFVFTGSVEGYSRRELGDLLERHGARVTSSVSGETDVLVVGENPGARKVDAADAHGVERMDEAAFREDVLARIA